MRQQLGSVWYRAAKPDSVNGLGIFYLRGLQRSAYSDFDAKQSALKISLKDFDTICFAQSDRLAHLFAIFFAKRIIQAYTVAPLKTDLQ